MNQILLGIFCIYKPIGSENLIYDLLLPWNHQLCAGVNNFILPLYFPIRALKTIYNRFRMIDKTFRASIARTKLDFIESSERLRSSKPPTLVTFGMDFIFQDKIFLSNYILVLRRTRRRYRRVIKYLSSTCITMRREAISQISFVLHEHLCSRGGLQERKKEKKKGRRKLCENETSHPGIPSHPFPPESKHHHETTIFTDCTNSNNKVLLCQHFR